MSHNTPDSHCTTRHLLAAAALLAAIGVLGSLTAGCGSTCEELRADYRRAVAGEIPGSREDSAADDSAPPHLAVGIRTSMLERLATRAAGDAVEAALTLSDALDVGGDSPVDVDALPEIETLGLERSSDACPHCFRISGELEGELDVRIPALGERRVPMDGTFEFDAPLTLAPGEREGTTALRLDLGEAARQNAPRIALNVEQLRDTWAHTIEQLLSSTLADSIVEQLEPVTIATFETPDLGVGGVSIRPSGLQISSDSDAVQMLLTTDLPVRAGPSAATLASAAAPTGGRNVAIALPSRFVAAGLARGFRSGDVERRYDLDGRGSHEGPVRITLSNLESPTPPSSDADDGGADAPQTLAFNFRAWNLPQDGPCYWFDGRATGELRTDEGEVEVGVGDVTLADSSRTGLSLALAKWTSAGFLQAGTRMLDASLNTDNLELPGGPYDFSSLGLTLDDGIVTLSAAASPGEADVSDDATSSDKPNSSDDATSSDDSDPEDSGSPDAPE